MNWARIIRDILVTIVTLNDTIAVGMPNCPCNGARMKIGTTYEGDFYCYCGEPKGCKRKGPVCSSKRQAKLQMKKEIENDRL